MARRLTDNAAPAGQLDLFEHPDSEPEPAAAPPKRRPSRPLPPGQVEWTTHRAGRDCHDCWTAQHGAAHTGGPVPARQLVRWRLRTHTSVIDLCTEHASQRGHTGLAHHRKTA